MEEKEKVIFLLHSVLQTAVTFMCLIASFMAATKKGRVKISSLAFVEKKKRPYFTKQGVKRLRKAFQWAEEGESVLF